ncbi:MAG: amidohydrolase [Clostridia bacterium]|nr:amidohydrolase [Clostridia bacterium]
MDSRIKIIDNNKSLILDVERHIWSNPETGYREWKTHDYLVSVFKSFNLEPQFFDKIPASIAIKSAKDGKDRVFDKIPGFYVDFETGRPGPRLAIFAEMDGLLIPTHPECDKETGAVHACGHHAQCAALVGVAAALSSPGGLDGISGSIRLIVVPAEEGIERDYRTDLIKKGVIRYTHGKKELMYRGLLDDVDLAFMIHTAPGRKLFCEKGTNGNIQKKFTFVGKSSHAADPQEGINALYAANVAINAANALRETFTEKDYIRFHPIITCGGSVVNAIPDKVTVEAYVRGADFKAYSEVNKKINRAFAAAAASLGCRLIINDTCGSAPRVYNQELIDVFASAGATVLDKDDINMDLSWDTGCSDFGDITQVILAVHPHIGGAAGTNHGSDYRIADPVLACVTSAKIQVNALVMLLENGAKRANEILKNHKPVFPGIAEFLAATDTVDFEGEAVKYLDNGDVLLKH